MKKNKNSPVLTMSPPDRESIARAVDGAEKILDARHQKWGAMDPCKVVVACAMAMVAEMNYKNPSSAIKKTK